MKRPNGSGTIVKLKGNRRKPYLVKIPDRDSRGYVIQRPLGYYRNGAEAQAALDDYNDRRKDGTAPSPDRLSMTVKTVYDGWSSREYSKLEKAGRSSSLYSHRAAWNKRVSRFAEQKMRDMTLDQWQSILDEDEDNGLSQSTINNDVILIRALYSYSMERDIVGKDYSQYLDVPMVDPKNPKGAFNDLQMAQLWKMEADGFPWADTVLMLCYTGYRITEFLTLSPFQYHKECGGYFTAGIKTAAGKGRVVPVHPRIKPLVEKWLSMGGDTVIVSPDGERITSNWYRENAFQTIAQALGIPEATPHWCRHTFETKLYSVEVDVLTRKLLMGHSTKGDITATYTHPTPEMLAKAVRKIS